MDTSIGFLRSGNHIHGRHKRIVNTSSPYKFIWKHLHMEASRAALKPDEAQKRLTMDDALHFARQSLDCDVCLKHLRDFVQNNQKWIYTCPEFFIYKLHTSANQNARSSGQMSSLPPKFSVTVRKYRGLLTSRRFSLLSSSPEKLAVDRLLGPE